MRKRSMEEYEEKAMVDWHLASKSSIRVTAQVFNVSRGVVLSAVHRRNMYHVISLFCSNCHKWFDSRRYGHGRFKDGYCEDCRVKMEHMERLSHPDP